MINFRFRFKKLSLKESLTLVCVLGLFVLNGSVEASNVRKSEMDNYSQEVVKMNGPLHINPKNPRYFADSNGKTVYLTGSHTWSNFQDDSSNPNGIFDYQRFLTFLKEHNHNFFRLWEWESTGGISDEDSDFGPMVFKRTGPGCALDGKPKYDLTQFNPEYFSRLRQRVKEAREQGMYVGVMLFQGFSVAQKLKKDQGNPWPGHPFYKDNNINGIDGDTDGDGNGYEVHTLEISAITAFQDAYVRKVIETVGDFDNIIYEISNESHGGATEWQYHMIDLIKKAESTRKYQHPVWMSFPWDGNIGMGANEMLFNSQAEAVSPRHLPGKDYKNDPPISGGEKVIILDTDHLWGVGGDESWVWKSFTRGLNPIFMDPYLRTSGEENKTLDMKWEGARVAMGQSLKFANRMKLADLVPTDDRLKCSTRYCLENPGNEYFIFQPDSSSFSLRMEAGKYHIEWFNPSNGTTVQKGVIKVRTSNQIFSQPWKGAAILYLSKK